MKSKQLVCNDCGCRFEIKDSKISAAHKPERDTSGVAKSKPTSLSCPECRSYNITTA